MFVFYDPIIEFLARPYFDVCARNPNFGCQDKFLITGPLDGFSTRIKVSGYGGIVVALPIVLWQIWRFITPGLHRNEKKYAIPFILSSVALFLFGAFIAYFIMPYAIEFLIGYSGPVTAAFTPNKYVSLLSIMMLAFGIGFLFPVLLVFLQLVGVITPKQLLELAAPGHRGDRGRRRRHHAERRSLQSRSAGRADVHLLRVFDRPRLVPHERETQGAGRPSRVTAVMLAP